MTSESTRSGGAPDELERGVAVGRGFHVETRAEQAAHVVAHVGVVVDEQDAASRAPLADADAVRLAERLHCRRPGARLVSAAALIRQPAQRLLHVRALAVGVSACALPISFCGRCATRAEG